MEAYLTGGGVSAVVVGVIVLIIRAISHKRIRSKCCGRVLEASIEIDDSRTPRADTPKLEAPPRIRTPKISPEPSTTQSVHSQQLNQNIEHLTGLDILELTKSRINTQLSADEN